MGRKKLSILAGILTVSMVLLGTACTKSKKKGDPEKTAPEVAATDTESGVGPDRPSPGDNPVKLVYYNELDSNSKDHANKLFDATVIRAAQPVLVFDVNSDQELEGIFKGRRAVIEQMVRSDACRKDLTGPCLIVGATIKTSFEVKYLGKDKYEIYSGFFQGQTDTRESITALIAAFPNQTSIISQARSSSEPIARSEDQWTRFEEEARYDLNEARRAHQNRNDVGESDYLDLYERDGEPMHGPHPPLVIRDDDVIILPPCNGIVCGPPIPPPPTDNYHIVLFEKCVLKAKLHGFSVHIGIGGAKAEGKADFICTRKKQGLPPFPVPVIVKIVRAGVGFGFSRDFEINMVAFGIGWDRIKKNFVAKSGSILPPGIPKLGSSLTLDLHGTVIGGMVDVGAGFYRGNNRNLIIPFEGAISKSIGLEAALDISYMEIGVDPDEF